MLTAIASVLPVWAAGLNSLGAHIPYIAAGLALPFVFMLISRGNGLASALVSILLAAVGGARALKAAQGQPFVLAEDLPAFFSSVMGGGDPFELTPAVIGAILCAGVAVALCAVLFRLPKVVRSSVELEAALDDGEELIADAEAVAIVEDDGSVELLEAVTVDTAEADGSAEQDA